MFYVKMILAVDYTRCRNKLPLTVYLPHLLAPNITNNQYQTKQEKAMKLKEKPVHLNRLLLSAKIFFNPFHLFLLPFLLQAMPLVGQCVG